MGFFVLKSIYASYLKEIPLFSMTSDEWPCVRFTRTDASATLLSLIGMGVLYLNSSDWSLTSCGICLNYSSVGHSKLTSSTEVFLCFQSGSFRRLYFGWTSISKEVESFSIAASLRLCSMVAFSSSYMTSFAFFLATEMCLDHCTSSFLKSYSSSSCFITRQARYSASFWAR